MIIRLQQPEGRPFPSRVSALGKDQRLYDPGSHYCLRDFLHGVLCGAGDGDSRFIRRAVAATDVNPMLGCWRPRCPYQQAGGRNGIGRF